MRNRTLLTFGVAALAAVCTASVGGASPAGSTQKAAATPCNVDVYVVDPDPKGLNVRDAPGVGGRVIATIPLDTDGTNVHLVASNANGWVQIDRAETIGGAVVFDRKRGWVSGNMLGTGTRGYGTRGVKLYAAARKGSVVGTVPPEDEVKVAGCSGDWVKGKYKNLAGWLQPEDQCPSPVTTCN